MSLATGTLTDSALVEALKGKLLGEFKTKIRDLIEPTIVEFAQDMLDHIDVKAEVWKDVNEQMQVIRAQYKIPEGHPVGKIVRV